MKRIRTEGRFSDRYTSLHLNKSRYEKIVEKYIPKIKSYLEDLQDLYHVIVDDEENHLDSIMRVDDGGFALDCQGEDFDEEYGIIRLCPKDEFAKITLAIEIFDGRIGPAVYGHHYGYYMDDEKFTNYKLDDIKGIASDETLKELTNDGELIKKYAEEYLPNYIKFMENQLDELENDEP